MTVIEEPLDPANQSLSEALRVSFRVLKFVLLLIVAAFAVWSVVFTVDDREVAVVLRFGEPVGEPRRPGFHMSLPFPIDQRIKVPTTTRNMQIDDFWLNIPEAERHKDLSELTAMGGGLDPAREGALLTGDRALMHLLLNVTYQVRDQTRPGESWSDPALFVQNVKDGDELLASVIRTATVAEAARHTADAIWRSEARDRDFGLDDGPTRVTQLAAAIQERSQQLLDDLRTGLTINTLMVERSYFPLQVKDVYLGVTAAENQRTQLIQEALKEREERLNTTAGPAWQALSEQIARFDQVTNESEHEEIIKEIERILVEEASGDAGERIQFALRDRERIVEETRSRITHFEELLDQYRLNPQLVRHTLQQNMLETLWNQPGLRKFILPPDATGPPVIWINTDPVEIRETERELLRQRAGRGGR